jgi:hypothetical protein
VACNPVNFTCNPMCLCTSYFLVAILRATKYHHPMLTMLSHAGGAPVLPQAPGDEVDEMPKWWGKLALVRPQLGSSFGGGGSPSQGGAPAAGGGSAATGRKAWEDMRLDVSK